MKLQDVINPFKVIFTESDLSRRSALWGLAAAGIGVGTGSAKAAARTYEPPLDVNEQHQHMLLQAARQHGIVGHELVSFLAQTAYESAGFKKLDEVGNHERYHGRGFIQLTGRSNYEEAGHAIGVDLVRYPQLAAKPEIAVKIAVWFWLTKVHHFMDRHHRKDWANLTQITKLVAGRSDSVTKAHQRSKWYYWFKWTLFDKHGVKI